MLTYEEHQQRQAAFAQAVTDAREREVAPVCPISRASCAGRSCACATRMSLGWVCGLTNRRSGARTRVVDVDADALLEHENHMAALTYMERGWLYA